MTGNPRTAAPEKIMVAMSGGVDSSVAALLLKQAGHEVVGVTMCLGLTSAETGARSCCGPQGVRDARRVCDQLGISHYVFDFAEALERQVLEPFKREYVAGRTPNPCVECNRHLKFDLLLGKARGLGFDALATGHFAIAAAVAGQWQLRAGKDRAKDQSYFLYAIRREALPFIRFPVGELTKAEVRRLALAAKLPVAEKPESQDICFVSTGTYRQFFAAAAGGAYQAASASAAASSVRDLGMGW